MRPGSPSPGSIRSTGRARPCAPPARTRSSVAYLIEVLVAIARELDARVADMSPAERAAHERAVLRLTAPSAPLPDFSGFHPSFTDCQGPTPEGDVRRAFYLSYNDSYCEYLMP